jgi:uncharacterized membrane protein YdjX (TVP38/TMEM64 family)
MLTTTPLNVGAGAVYGVALGTAVTLSGAVAGAFLCFLIARFWAGASTRPLLSST